MHPEEIFEKKFALLNEAQREAVETVYGPVMVMAGPGTGKTEVLAMRIAQLLRSEAQVNPAEILCLTYTDDAANSMRNRLVEIIGPQAHKLQIGTFHAYCNQIIQQNQDYFAYRELELIDDFGRMEIVHEILDELPDGHVLRRSSSIYYDTRNLLKLFGLMKEEYLSVEVMEEAIDKAKEDLLTSKDMVYKINTRTNKAGDFKKDLYNKAVSRLEKTRAAAKLMDVFVEKMKVRGLYDFSDMILWVLAAFQDHPELLMQYQERSQFILVDEFQDTNGAQNRLLSMLLDYWEDPNVFVVGDDDQSVFEFQGARIENIIEFFHRYESTIKVVVLKENYRSSQPVLDWAAKSISKNKGRLLLQIPELKLDKDIRSAHPRFEKEAPCPQPVVRESPNQFVEEAHLVLQLEELIHQGVAPSDIAVLYAQHKQVDRIIDLMDKRGLPYFIKKPANLLNIPMIQQLLQLIQYLEEETVEPLKGEPILFKLMHSPFFQIHPADIASLAIYMNQHQSKNPNLKYWRTALTEGLIIESIGLKNPAAIRRLGEKLDSWMAMAHFISLPALLEKIVYDSGVLPYILSRKDHIYYVEALKSLFEFLGRCADRQPGLSLADFLHRLEKLEEMGLTIPMQTVFSRKDGVQFFTAHASKGNEFEYVFLIGCTDNFWEKKKKSSSGFLIPDTLAYSETKLGSSAEEIARRLFYVAMTRAKKFLQISFSAQNEEGKSIQNAALVDEVCPPSQRVMIEIDDARLQEILILSMQPMTTTKIELAHRASIDQVIRQMAMSTSSLSKYLRCPLSYYYENVLKVPFVKRDSMAYGTAVHAALDFLFRQARLRQGQFPELPEVLNEFFKVLNKEKAAFHGTQFARRRDQGVMELSEYYQAFMGEFSKDSASEYKIDRFSLGGIPVTGKIDLIENHNGSVVVVDFKTGSPVKKGKYLDPPSPDNHGGDYWRQMAFYKLLLEENPKEQMKVSHGRFEFMTKNEKGVYYRPKVELGPEDVELVRGQIKMVYASIMNQDFDEGCGKEECTWCRFVRSHEIDLETRDAVEVEDAYFLEE